MDLRTKIIIVLHCIIFFNYTELYVSMLHSLEETKSTLFF